MRVLFYSFLILASLSTISKDLDISYERALEALRHKPLDSSKVIAEDFLSEAKSQNDKYYIIKAYFILGYIEDELKNFGDAIIYYLEGARFAESYDSDNTEIKNNLISLNKNLAIILGNYSHYDLSHKFLNKGLEVARTIGNTDQEKKLINYRIHELVEEGQFTKALEEIELTLSNYSLDSKMLISLKNKAGIATRGLNRSDEAIANYLYIIETADTTNKFYSYALHNLGEIYLEEKQYDLALEYLSKAIESKKNNNLNKDLISSLADVAKIYSERGDYNRALKFLEQGEDLESNNLTDPDAYTIYKQTSEIYDQLGMTNNALYYNNIYTRKLEEFIAKQKEIEELDKKYNIQLLTERYFDLLAANEEKREAERLAQFGVGGTTIFFLIVLAFIYFRQYNVRTSIQKELKKIESISKV